MIATSIAIKNQTLKLIYFLCADVSLMIAVSERNMHRKSEGKMNRTTERETMHQTTEEGAGMLHRNISMSLKKVLK